MRRSVAGLAGVILAVLLSQFPEYAQQYTQRLGGAVDELRVVTQDFDQAAAAGGLTRAAALDRYNASNDDFLAGRGTSMTATFQRYEQLSTTLERIEGAGSWERFRSLASYFDTDIGRRTLEAYKPAIPVTPENFLYAGAGFLLGYLIFSSLWQACALPFLRQRFPVYR